MTLNTAAAFIISADMYLLPPQWIMQTDKRILHFYDNGIKIMHDSWNADIKGSHIRN